MIPTATIVHQHHHGASGWEIFAWCLAAVMLTELFWWLRDAVPAWWQNWQDRHADEPIEDAADLSTCGDCEGTEECRHCHGKCVTWVRDPLDGSLVESEDCDACDGLGICFSCDDAEETDKLRAAREGQFVPTTTTRDDAARAVEESETR